MPSRPNLEMTVLNRISRILVQHRDVSGLLNQVLAMLSDEMGLQRGTITLRRGDVLFIEASHGLSAVERLRGKYHLGEGITGKVAESAKPLIIPDISKEPGFLDRTQARSTEKDIAFICVPILFEDEVIGTMSIDRKLTPGTDLERDFNLLETVANLLAEAVSNCLKSHEEREQLLAENFRLKQELDLNPRPTELIGNCNAMKSVYATISQIADSNAPVLIRGNPGTGKELLARAIQRSSKRSGKPFVVVNCSSLSEELFQSELFGHEKGAFAGAVSRRIGRVEAANTGTLFLDEIGDLSIAMQVDLLHFIQDGSFRRVGSDEILHSDVRLIAGSACDLDKLLKQGKFREDLYYRLNVCPVHLPDLAARRSDIMLLAEHFLEKYNRLHHRNIRRISTPAINMIMAYHWPGNVRELENCIERAVLTASDEVINAYNLPPSLQTAQTTDSAKISNSGANFTVLVESFERELIVEALKLHHGNVAAAARSLQLTIRITHYKIAKLGINPDWYK